MKMCTRCKKEFEKTKNGKCVQCRRDYDNERNRAKKIIVCAYCGKDYSPDSKSRECSLKCRLMMKVKMVNGCWEWQGSLTKLGYGNIFYGKYYPTHRASYEVFKGAIPEGINVCHICDNRKCINPDHLFLGTQKDNMHDASLKGKMIRLEENKHKYGKRKLSEKDIRFIRESLTLNCTHEEISNMYNVTISTISDIVCRRTWDWVK